MILFVKTVFDFKQIFKQDIRPAGYSENETGYPAGYKISRGPDIRYNNPNCDYDLVKALSVSLSF